MQVVSLDFDLRFGNWDDLKFSEHIWIQNYFQEITKHHYSLRAEIGLAQLRQLG
jgi:hypothetical protein